MRLRIVKKLQNTVLNLIILHFSLFIESLRQKYKFQDFRGKSNQHLKDQVFSIQW